tara:strand:- start:135 stop:311 length:177 start_codon:yes stop_codon:yes gene_type:complete
MSLVDLFIMLMIWLLPNILRLVSVIYRKRHSIFGGTPPVQAETAEPLGRSRVPTEQGL